MLSDRHDPLLLPLAPDLELIGDEIYVLLVQARQLAQPDPRRVEQQDANGNPVSQSGVTVTAVVASGPGGTLANASATTTGSGAASFSGLTLSGTVGSYTLRFEDTNLTPATSSAITLSAGTAATIAENGGNGQTATAGTA